jgi:localization factor PodJL
MARSLFVPLLASLALLGCEQVKDRLERADAYLTNAVTRPERPAANAPVEDPETMYRRGLGFLDGTSGTRDPEMASFWLGRAAEAGHAEAQYLLGAGYALRERSPQSDREALAWFEKAANQGHARAQYQVGDAFAAGRAVPREPEWAALWFARAASRGHVEAQYRLGLMHVAGIGVPRDALEGYRWLAIAARGGHGEADRYRTALAEKLAPGDVERLDERARGWRARPADAPGDAPAIRYVQARLLALGHGVGAVDGAMGPRTRAAVSAYQQEKGLAADGIVTARLIEALRPPPTASPAQAPATR